MRILSGVQSSGRLHLGNHFGAIRQWVALQDEAPGNALFFIADLHADRKSTRLNSSHVKSSYAVFCLKKKKKRQERWRHDSHRLTPSLIPRSARSPLFSFTPPPTP